MEISITQAVGKRNKFFENQIIKMLSVIAFCFQLSIILFILYFKSLKKDKNFDEIRTGILALRPNLAFAVGRGVIPRDFYEVMDKCMGKIKDLSDFEVFIKLLEAIVGYYKYYSMKHGR